jgi:3-oxoacyl-[acyl-carrier-protein] synthase II
MRERVVITGIGCISCFGIGHAAFAEGVRSGASGIAPIALFDTSTCHSHCAASIVGFDPAAFIAPIKLRKFDRASRVAVASTRLLFDDAAYPAPSMAEETGISLGTFTAGLDAVVEYMTGFTDRGPTGVPAILFSNTVANAPASLCAIEFGLRGPNVTFNQREASSLAAMAFAVGAVRDGRAPAMVSGGVDCMEETFFKVHDRFRALSPMRERDAGVAAEEGARPFDRRRNGAVLGEGGFLVLLESAALAAQRSARSYGEILGVGVASSATALNGWPEGPSGLARAMRLALSDAALDPEAIAAVIAAANGSPHLDRLEAAALRDVFGARAVPVASVKGATGESGAAGAAGLVAGLRSVAQGAIVPTAGFSDADPACAVAVSRDAQAVAGDTFLLNSVALGGTIYSMVVRASTHD